MCITLLAIDLHKSIYSSNMGHYEYGTVSEGFERIRQVLDAATELGYSIYATVYGDNTLDSRVASYAKQIIKKPEHSAFKETQLGKLLKVENSKELLVFGFNRDACVIETVKDAVRSGYKVITSEELMFAIEFYSGRFKSLDYYRNEKNVLFLDKYTDVLDYMRNRGL